MRYVITRGAMGIVGPDLGQMEILFLCRGINGIDINEA